MHYASPARCLQRRCCRVFYQDRTDHTSCRRQVLSVTPHGSVGWRRQTQTPSRPWHGRRAPRCRPNRGGERWPQTAHTIRDTMWNLDTRCPTPRRSPRETARSCRSADTHPHRCSTTYWLRVRCVPDHLVGLSTDSLHPPLDMHRPTPHSRVGLLRHRLSEALRGTELRKPTKPKGHKRESYEN